MSWKSTIYPLNKWANTLEKRLFSIFRAMDSLRTSGIVLSRIFLCWPADKVKYFLIRSFQNGSDLLVLAIYCKLKSLPLSDSEHGVGVKPGSNSSQVISCKILSLGRRQTFIQPRLHKHIGCQDGFQILLLGGELCYYFIHLSNDGPKKRSRTKEEEDTKHLESQPTKKPKSDR